MRYFGQFLSNLRSSANLSLEELAKLTDTSRSTISRIENSEVSQPFKGPIRKLLICVAEILCTSRTETERYLNLANIDKSTLPEIEQIQLGFIPKVAKGSPDEITDLERLEKIYEQLLRNLETKEQELGVSDAPPNLKLKTQEYRNTLQEIHRRLDALQNRDDSENIFTTPIIQAHAQPLENIGGRIVVGNQYGEHKVVDKVLSRTLWHPTSRMRLLQFLFHTYGIDATAKTVKEKQRPS